MPGEADGATPGELIGGRYTVHKVLGRGGFGIVYLVTAGHDGRSYALKTFLKSSADPKANRRFRQEAEIWVSLGAHPNLVQAFFVDEIEGRLYVGMEYVRPGASGLNSLDGYLAHEPPDMLQALRWGVELCYGMEYAVAQGVRSHRDLKPANVMISEAGHVKVTDFGLAALGREAPALDLSEGVGDPGTFHGQTVRGMGFGTPTHMPPEQFSDAGASDERTDVYAAGVILYQMVTGQLPVPAPPVVGAGLEARFRFWKDFEEAHRAFVLPKTGHPLDAVLGQCIVADPAERYSSFAALRADLQGLLKRFSGTTVPLPQVAAPAEEDWLNRGTSLSKLGRFDEALACFDRVLAARAGRQPLPGDRPGLATAWSGRGTCLARLNRNEEAIEAYGHVLRLSPRNTRAQTNLGISLRAVGRNSEALASFDAALRVDQDLPGTWANRGNLLAEMGRREEALQSYDRALRLDPHNAGTLANRGMLLALIGRTEDALASFEAAVSANETLGIAQRGCAASLVAVGRYEEALRMYANLERTGGMTGDAWLGRGVALAHQEQFQSALGAFDRAAEHTMFRSRARGGAAFVSLRRHQFQAGFVAVEEALDDRPHDRDLCTLKALLLHGRGEYLQAAELWQTQLERRSGAVEASNLACTLVHLDQLPRAIGVLQEAFSMPESASTRSVLHYNLGAALGLQERYEEAAAQFTALLELEPYWGAAWSNRSACAFAAGRHSEGIAALNHAYQYELHHTAFWQSRSRESNGPLRLADDILAADAAGLLGRQQESGHPLVRNPRFRPPVLLIPRYLPSILSN